MKPSILSILFLAILFSSSCGRSNNQSPSTETNLEVIAGNNFFQNSNRRSVSKAEQRHIVRASSKNRNGSCTAFWVENTQNRFIVGTARHCYDWSITSACDNDVIRILPNGELKGLFQGRCEQLIAASVLHDVVLIEVSLTDSSGKKVSDEMRQTVREAIAPLRLADYVPSDYDRLKMYGYPVDDERKGLPTTSEDCWVLPEDSPSVWYGIDHNNLEERFKRYIEYGRDAPTDPREEQYRGFLRQNLLKYNCSVYGGNSGGPVILENTIDVVGLPFSYYPELYTEIPEDYGHIFEDIKSFVDHHRETLKSFGVTLSTSK